MMKNLSSLQQRVLTGVALLALVGLIGWIDNFFIMWAFLGVGCTAMDRSLFLP